MKASVQGHDPHGLLLAGLRHDGMPTHAALRGEPPVKVLDTVDLISSIHRERHSI